MFTAPGFDTSKHIGYDVMHEVAGIVGDTVVKLLLAKRYTEAVQQFETEHNRYGRRPKVSTSTYVLVHDLVSNMLCMCTCGSWFGHVE